MCSAEPVIALLRSTVENILKRRVHGYYASAWLVMPAGLFLTIWHFEFNSVGVIVCTKGSSDVEFVIVTTVSSNHNAKAHWN